MDERYIFNPYGFGTPFFTPNGVVPPNVSTNGQSTNDQDLKSFYENQYHYYRYLNEMIDYQLKSRELQEKFSRNTNNSSVNKNM